MCVCVCVCVCLCVCVCALMHFCACFKERHIFPHCQHHSSGLLLFKRRAQRSLLFFSVPWPGSVLSCSVLNWTLTGCQQARGCMLPASAFQEARVFVQGVSKSLEMLSSILQNLNSSIKEGVLVWWLASTSYCTKGMCGVHCYGVDVVLWKIPSQMCILYVSLYVMWVLLYLMLGSRQFAMVL